MSRLQNTKQGEWNWMQFPNTSVLTANNFQVVHFIRRTPSWKVQVRAILFFFFLSCPFLLLEEAETHLVSICHWDEGIRTRFFLCNGSPIVVKVAFSSPLSQANEKISSGCNVSLFYFALTSSGPKWISKIHQTVPLVIFLSKAVELKLL